MQINMVNKELCSDLGDAFIDVTCSIVIKGSNLIRESAESLYYLEKAIH